MTTDRRELIAARLLALAAAIPGVTEAVRNKIGVTAKTGPRIVVWDGDERVIVQKPTSSLKSVGSSVIVEMTPEIQILAEDSSVSVGSRVNAIRLLLLAAITQDALYANRNTAGTLASLLGDNGDLRYEGCGTQLERGQRLEAELRLNFAIVYPLMPDPDLGLGL